MEKRKINRGCMEANTLAILDSSTEFHNHRDSQEAKDDRIDFLEAVRTASIVPEHGTPPTKKMVEAVFQILKAGKSLELIISSYELLNEIENRFPRVHISESSGIGSRELVVVKEAWLPFVLSSDVMSSEKETKGRKSCGLFDPNGFHELLLGIAEMAYKTISQRLNSKFLGNMLLFQYLVNVLEGDFVPRINMYKERLNWNFLRECLLNMLLASRRITYKVLMKDCLYTICSLSQDYAGNNNESDCSEPSIEKSSENHNTDVAIALLEVQRTTCMAMQKFLIMIMELDESREKADMLRQMNRSDGLRTPLVEIILDELTYHRKVLPSFLQVFNDPKWKFEIIVRYLLKYTKPSVHTRRSNGPSEDSAFLGILKSFSDSSSTRNIIKKLNVEVVQLLLAHAFLAYTSMASQQHPSTMPDGNEAVIDSSSLVEISKNVTAAFNCLRKAYEKIEISSLGKEALFTAAMIISIS
ncbi:Negative regulator of systemic acquired resistance, putative isoform 3 [Hibiscus syriacus]|uniref:Negative regulator of systemic acquired resistance, putative isoform 3 n=2 Tax=Hibiscus syriacus TaxID=106335 RepID=A0A6A3BVJ2_HIBSY|nr:negative regulator of systemic acquired resistance SNI1-like isoform X1 [Hibiscus syriacus]KAE8719911.1 Negative regulator of systemic acquired resistance, putative isoform 3 [Hibiscus syriacus]